MKALYKMTAAQINESQSGNSKSRILMGSLVGTTIEFFDFYIYANACLLYTSDAADE